MIKLEELLKIAIERKCSDVHLSVGIEAIGRIDLKLEKITKEIFTQNHIIEYAKEILEDKFLEIENIGELDKSFSISGLSRFRVNIYKQRNSFAMAIRIIPFNLPTLEEFNIPNKIHNFISSLNNGLVLITGAVGSGKSTTISSIINDINSKEFKHIITIENPIEFLYKHNKSVINQREIGSDTKTYLTGIDSALRENPDILVVDNISDYETLKLVLKCSEAGILVIASMYGNSVVHTISSIFDMCDQNNNQLRIQFSNSLKCILNQRLILDVKNKRVCVSEILINTPGVSNVIKENKIKHITPLMQNGIKMGMCTLDISLIEAYKNGKISREVFLQNISNKELAAKIILNY